MDLLVRAARPEELGALRHALGLGFGFDADPAHDEVFAATSELERTRCAFEGDEMVGTLGCYSLELAVPGGALGTGGTTWITVRGTHRRQGVLRAMMAPHFEDVRERGEPLAALWASESGIYGRFGYGCAAELMRVEVERAHSAFEQMLPRSGRVRLLDAKEALELVPQVYERTWRERPGHFARSRVWWETRRLHDPSFLREGGSALRTVVYEAAGRARGYALYRVAMAGDDHGLPRGSVRVVELEAEDPEAQAALWRHLLDVDLTDRLQAWNVATDDPLPNLLADPRRATRAVRDGLWIRLMDVARALSGRRYAAEGSLVLRVLDATLSDQDGVYQLEGGPDGARCRRTESSPDLTLDVRDLAAVFLGGVGLRALSRAGRVEGSAEALARADAMFGWDPAPWCPELF